MTGDRTGAAQPTGDIWEARIIQTGTVLSGTLTLRLETGVTMTGYLVDSTIKGGIVHLSVDFAPGTPVPSTAAEPTAALTTLSFDGTLDRDGKLVGDWQDSTGRSGTIVLSRVPVNAETWSAVGTLPNLQTPDANAIPSQIVGVDAGNVSPWLIRGLGIILLGLTTALALKARRHGPDEPPQGDIGFE